MNRSLLGSIALTKIKHYMLTVKGKTGPVKGIFIPVDAHDQNHLVKGQGETYYLPVRVLVRDEPDKYGQHGFVAQSVDSKTYKEATEAEKEAFKSKPILGNLKDFEAPANDGYMGNGGFEPQAEFLSPEGEDGLPF
jgi:hypothetical protein